MTNEMAKPTKVTTVVEFNDGSIASIELPCPESVEMGIKSVEDIPIDLPVFPYMATAARFKLWILEVLTEKPFTIKVENNASDRSTNKS
jgi:hypothetical protein